MENTKQEITGPAVRSSSAYSGAVSSPRTNAAVVLEVHHALTDLSNPWVPVQDRGVLIGGTAMSFYIRPRTSTNIDLLFLDLDPGLDLDSGALLDDARVPGFKPYRKGIFQEKHRYVDVKVVTPAAFTELPVEVAERVLGTAFEHEGLMLASIDGLIALKLCSAFAPTRKSKDSADIVALLVAWPDSYLQSWPLCEKHFELLDLLRLEAKGD